MPPHLIRRLGLAACVAFLFAIVGFILLYTDARGPLKQETLVVIPKGSSVGHIALRLDEHGVIHSPRLFSLTYYALAHNIPLHAGEYRFIPGVTPRKILQMLQKGEVHYRSLTIPEGLTTTQIMTLIDNTEGLTGAVPVDIDEGELLPETYLFTYGDSREALVKRMFLDQHRLLTALWPARSAELPFTTPREAVILASIVEKETALPEERPRIAAVFINRLRRGMRLQSDPTVIYALTGGTGPLDRPLTRHDLRKELPHNTYTNAGLPPTPIAHPGKAALQAVLNPIETLELYFVADGTGGHAFAKTLAEHNKNVRAWRRIREKMAKTTSESQPGGALATTSDQVGAQP